MIVQLAVRTIGPILLRGGLGGGGTSTTNTDNRTSDDDFDDFDDSSENEVDDKSKVAISLPTFAPETSETKSDAPVSAPSASFEAPARFDLFNSFDDDTSSSVSQISTLSVR